MVLDVSLIFRKLLGAHYPFSALSIPRADEAGDALRLFDLITGEVLTLSGATKDDYLYVLEGSVELSSKDGFHIKLGVNDTKPMPFSFPGPVITVTATEDTILCHADSGMLDHLLAWDNLTAVRPIEGPEAHSRMDQLKHCLAFRNLPLDCVEKAFRAMRSVCVKKGEEVVRAKEAGEAFYVITRGRAEVWRANLYETEQKKVAELTIGDAFGEEALITSGYRNATVRMVEDGRLLALDKADYDRLFRSRMVKEVDPPVAKAMADSGHELLDVRYKEEFEEKYIPGATLIPLPELRERLGELNSSKNYVVYCRSGKRSAVAALLMCQSDIDAVSMRGGIIEWPYETKGFTAPNQA